MANLAGLAAIVALVAIGFAYVIDALARKAETEASTRVPAAIVPINVAGVALSVPAPWLTDPDQPDSDFSDRLDLSVALDLGGAPVPVTLTLLPRSRVRASAALVDSVYLQHFGAEEIRGAPGLIGKPLVGGEGYDGETVWYDPIHAKPFVAKCAETLSEDLPARCLRTLVLDSGLAVIVDFPETGLAAWRDFDTRLGAVLIEIGAGAVAG